MEKQKKWHLYLILAVIAITIYNILPTILYYAQPLKEPISQKQAGKISRQIAQRINESEAETIEWIKGYAKHLGVSVRNIRVFPDSSRLIEVKLASDKDAETLRRFLPYASMQNTDLETKLNLLSPSSDQPLDTLVLSRTVPVRIGEKEIDNYFSFIPKFSDKGEIAQEYFSFMAKRADEVQKAIKQTPAYIEGIENFSSLSPAQKKEVAEAYAEEIVELKPLTSEAKLFVFLLRSKLPSEQAGGVSKAIEALNEAIALGTSENQNNVLKEAIELLNSVNPTLSSGESSLIPFTGAYDPNTYIYRRPFSHPLFSEFTLDALNDKMILSPRPEVRALLSSTAASEKKHAAKEALYKAMAQEISKITSATGEEFQEALGGFTAKLSPIVNPQSVLALNLDLLGKQLTESVKSEIQERWSPYYEDFKKEHYPLNDYADFSKLPLEEQHFGLVLISPEDQKAIEGAPLSSDSLYVIAKGLKTIRTKYENNPTALGKDEFEQDLKNLGYLLSSYGFTPIDPSQQGYPEAYSQDIVFELKNFYLPVIAATKEQFIKQPGSPFAFLYLTNLEQRILAENQIDNAEHEKLLRSRDEYNHAAVSDDKIARFLTAPPTKNIYWNNLLLSVKKYFRGDDSKVLKWGLDLSGGKSVRIGLEDHNKNPVTDQESLEQAVSELYKRINKMGVSEQAIRIENEHIVVDFPGSQEISAQDLIKASSMYFSIVNEKFSPLNRELNADVQKFLNAVWEEASLSGKTDVTSVNEIGWKHLGGDLATGKISPTSAGAKTLYEAGLVLANPKTNSKSSIFDDSISSIGILKGDTPSDWYGQSNPLVILFNDYALEGSSLTDIRVGYDPKDGNLLSFKVKSSYEKQPGSPQEDFYSWTKHFSADQIQGTEKGQFSRGQGWRMAVVLNDRIISIPRLQAALRDGGVITGKFTQREVDKLAADLKAGSLSFSPKILSEFNLSPELGLEERTAGIQASVVALAAVAVMMIAVYHYWGVIATIAVFFNILIIWGVLQNFGAAITLPGIAGIVLTIGMAVDANVLVFERLREEFALSGKLFSSMKTAYSKAFSAIIDSNVTTVIAALILLQFDSGPIKGFAVTLIIGIVSSMFTALFMTRYFFTAYLRNSKDSSLGMVQLFKNINFDFLKYAKLAGVLTLVTVAVGGFLFFKQAHTIFGMDFTGGYSLTLAVEEQPGVTRYISQVENALNSAGAYINDVDVRQLNRPEQLKIFLSTAMEESSHPFYGLPEEVNWGGAAYKYQRNPRLNWVVEALENKGIKISQEDKFSLHENWSVMSGQFSNVMRNNALIALSLAMLSILIYITIRFEFNYALAAVIALAHDLLLTLSFLALFHWIGFPVQINLEIIGALMTIVGYSLNDTIIIFDRVREDLHLHKKWGMVKLMNHALNVTLSRTVMTSGTTLAVLITLVLLGGKSIFGFAFIMTIGVLVGTLSSLFIAPPILLLLQRRSLDSSKPVTGEEAYTR